MDQIYTGLQESITRLFGGDRSAIHESSIGGDARRDANAAAGLFLHRAQQIASPGVSMPVAAADTRASTPSAAAGAQLAAILADHPGVNAFELDAVRDELTSATGDDEDDHSANSSPLERIVTLPNLSLSRLLADSFTMLATGKGKVICTSTTPPRQKVDREDTRLRPGPTQLFLPVANDRVLEALSCRVHDSSDGGAIVRQIISHVDLALRNRVHSLSRSCAKDTAEVGVGAHLVQGGDGTHASPATGEETSTLSLPLLSAGLRLAADACLGLFALSRGENSPPSPTARAVGGGQLATPPALSHCRVRDALGDVFGRPFLLRLACPLLSEATALASEGVTAAVALPAAVASSVASAVADNAPRETNGAGGDVSDDEPWTPLSKLRRMACAEMSALVVAAASAEEDFSAASVETIEKKKGEDRAHPSGAPRRTVGIVTEAAAPFLDRLCR